MGKFFGQVFYIVKIVDSSKHLLVFLYIEWFTSLWYALATQYAKKIAVSR